MKLLHPELDKMNEREHQHTMTLPVQELHDIAKREPGVGLPLLIYAAGYREDVLDHPGTVEILKKYPDKLMTAQLKAQAWLHSPVIYQVESGLSEKFLRTRIGGVRIGDIKLPYPVVYLASDVFEYEGCYVQHCANYLHASFVSVVSQDMYSYANVALHTEDEDVLIEDLFKQYRKDKILQPRSRIMFRWAVNVLLYITWCHTGEHWIIEKEARQLWERLQKEKNPTKRKKLSKRLGGMTYHRRRLIVDRTRPSDSTDTGAGTGRKLETRVWVTGYWRRPVGYQIKGGDPKWIQPYWRGPEGAPVVRPPRLVTAKGAKEVHGSN